MKDPLGLRTILHYLPLYKGRIFVIKISGTLVQSPAEFAKIAIDIALMQTLGVSIIVVHGINDDTKKLLASSSGIAKRPTDAITDELMEKLKPICTSITAEILSKFSQVDHAVSDIRACVGTFVKAKRKGVIDGIDQKRLGEVDSIDIDGVKRLITSGFIPTFSPLATTRQGELLYIPADELAAEIAIQMSAVKLIYLTGVKGIYANGNLISQLSVPEAQEFAQGSLISGDVLFKLEKGINACQKGVSRIHFLDGWQDGALLLEILSRDGCGSMLYGDTYINIRSAELDDVDRIMVITDIPAQEQALICRTVEEIRQHIGEYFVYEKDGFVIGCCRVHAWPNEQIGEFSHLVVAAEYRHQGIAMKLLELSEEHFRQQGLARIFALTTRTESWFVNRGFREQDIKYLPEEKRQAYNAQRKSKVMGKSLMD